MKLNDIEKGQRAIINKIDLPEKLKDRFVSLGLNRGSIIKVCRKTLNGDNLNIKLDCATCIVLSKEEAEHIKVSRVEGDFNFCNRNRNRNENDALCCDEDDCSHSNPTSYASLISESS
jgi:Fe2+ transport system protein FeoA